MAKKSRRGKKNSKPVGRIGKKRSAKKPSSKRVAGKKSVRASFKNNRVAKKKTAARLLSKGGGNATAAGVTFQASVGAIFAAQLLAERPLDGRLGLGGAKPQSIRFESEAPLDDVAVETTAHGWLLIQAKNSLTLSGSLSSELGKTAEQIVAQWAASTAGAGKRGWDRPLDLTRDRFIIAVGPTASGTIINDLAKALTSLRSSHSAPLPSGQAGALETLKKLLKAAWRKIYSKPAKAADIEKLLPFIAVLRLDVGGPDRDTAVEVLAHVTQRQTHAASAFHVLEGSCQTLMIGRLGTDAGLLRAFLAQQGISLKAAPSFQDDVVTLKKYSDAIASVLKDFEIIEVDGNAVSVTRESSDAVCEAAKANSLLIIGDPGAGKSAVVNAAAATLRAAKFDIIQLAVDRLQVDTSDGLRSALSLTHPLLTVLENWPGINPAFLFIDALDATRGGSGEAVFRNLIRDVMALPSKRWRIVASIRSFDLRLGEQFRELFEGAPADLTFRDPAFSNVRHINVPRWSPTELATLLKKAPSLATAIDTGGDKLRDLALIPFNTRLLAELISSGISADAFGMVGSQIELLSLYWRKRVVGIGSGAEVCLRAVVAEMVKGRTLQSSKITAAAANANALDRLMEENVLVAVAGDRSLVFRHHILFDYAASRVFIDPNDILSTAALLRKERDLGIMLAPALSFALQELWLIEADGHPEFWKAAVGFAGDAGADPIARSVAARMACELPRSSKDVAGLISLLDDTTDADTAFTAFPHIVGALQVRADEKMPLLAAPWCALADAAARHVQPLAWSLRSLLALLIPKVAGTETDRLLLGKAARALFTFVLGNTAGSASRLIPIAIEFVADTYDTDPTVARQLLSQLLVAARLSEHAHEEMPPLARKAKTFVAFDPEFLIKLFHVIYGHKVTDTSATHMGHSQILSLTSNKRQDYDHAKWQLKEAIPFFLEKRPEQGIRAVDTALEAHNSINQRSSSSTPQSFIVNGVQVALLDDMSHIWAHDPNDPHAHADNAASIILAFRKAFEKAPDQEVQTLASLAVKHIRLAVLWSRLFLVATKRPAVLGTALWPFVSAKPFLLSADTRKDAIDAVASIYPQISRAARAVFETDIAKIEFKDVENPARRKQRFLATLFRAIGEANLATESARATLRDAETAMVASENIRPYRITSSVGVSSQHWFLEDKGVDIDAPENTTLLRLVEALDNQSPGGVQATRLSDEIVRIKALDTALGTVQLKSPSADVLKYAEDSLLRACETLAKRKDELSASPKTVVALTNIVSKYINHPRPDKGDVLATGPRSHAVGAALRLCSIGQATADLVLPMVRPLLDDPDVGVRLAFVDAAPQLWEYRRPDLWNIAHHVTANEKNSFVLRSLTGFLCRAVHHDQGEVEALIAELTPLAKTEDDPHGDKIIEAIGSMVAVLWLWYERPQARAWLDEWLIDPVEHQAELRRATDNLRGAVISGYRTADADDVRLQLRSQRFASQVVELMSSELERYLSAPAESRTEADHVKARVAAQLIDSVGDQLYYSTGAFRAAEKSEETGLTGDSGKKAFLDDNHAMLQRFGDSATPHTIYNLIDLFDFLIPADPPKIFDLVAHALLHAGRKWGYEFESLGADRFVKVVGVFLADHRDIFRDAARRDKLIACLDTFVQVGWPSARRLLYRLPELL